MNEVTLHSCGMCSSKVYTDGSLVFSKVNNCCSSKTINPSVKEQFLKAKSNDVVKVSILAVFALQDNIVQNQIISKNIAFYDNSPPGILKSSVYILNSSFLI